MNKIFRVLAIAAAGVILGSVATRFIKLERFRTVKNERSKSLKDREGLDRDVANDDKNLEKIDNCFI